MKFYYELYEKRQTRNLADYGEIEAESMEEAQKKVFELYEAEYGKNTEKDIFFIHEKEARYRMSRQIKRMTHEEIDALSDEERKKRRKHIDTVTALEAHDIGGWRGRPTEAASTGGKRRLCPAARRLRCGPATATDRLRDRKSVV